MYLQKNSWIMNRKVLETSGRRHTSIARMNWGNDVEDEAADRMANGERLK
jgi:hypothetical protein